MTGHILKHRATTQTFAMHCLSIELERRPVKKAPRQMKPELFAKIEVDVDNIVPYVPKGNDGNLFKKCFETRYNSMLMTWLLSCVPKDRSPGASHDRIR